MNNKVLLDSARQENGTVISGTEVFTKANLVSYDGKKYAVNPKAMLTINVTTKCNAKCFFCYNGMTFMRDDDFVDCGDSEFIRAANFAKLAGIEVATVTGGEPTLNPRKLLKIIRFLKQTGFSTIRMHTNGYLLCENITIDGQTYSLWKWLEIYGVNDLSISIADYRNDKNAAIMGLDNMSMVKKFLPFVKHTTMRIRFSCFLCSLGVKTHNDIVEYLKFAFENGVNNVIFRLMPTDLPKDILYLRKIVTMLEQADWIVVYKNQKNDSIIFELSDQNRNVSLSCVKEELDPDKKIRRLIYMPDRVLYTSWIDSSSFLFDDDNKKIVRSALKKKQTGTYPGNVWNKEIPKYVHMHEAQSIDLHVHSTVSDGLLSPLQVIKRASDAGIKKMVFTEHNCLHDSIECVIEIANRHNIEIPLIGVEFSTVYCLYNVPWMKFHLLVYGKTSEQFDFLNGIYNPNTPRNEYLANAHKKLYDEGIVSLTFEEVYAINDELAPTKKKMYTRSPLAKHIASNLGISLMEAKDRFLPQLKEEDRYKEYLDIEKVISLAHKNGCVTVLAHPGWIRSYDKSNQLSEEDLFVAIVNLARSGLDGIEVVHRQNNEIMRDKLFRIATELGLVVTGGSDFHGKPRCTLGENGTDENELQRLMERIK